MCRVASNSWVYIDQVLSVIRDYDLKRDQAKVASFWR